MPHRYPALPRGDRVHVRAGRGAIAARGRGERLLRCRARRFGARAVRRRAAPPGGCARHFGAPLPQRRAARGGPLRPRIPGHSRGGARLAPRQRCPADPATPGRYRRPHRRGLHRPGRLGAAAGPGRAPGVAGGCAHPAANRSGAGRRAGRDAAVLRSDRPPRSGVVLRPRSRPPLARPPQHHDVALLPGWPALTQELSRGDASPACGVSVSEPGSVGRGHRLPARLFLAAELLATPEDPARRHRDRVPAPLPLRRCPRPLL